MRQTIPQLNTPFENPIEEIEVTDPTHPLYGRVFTLLSITSALQPGSRHVLVSYREYMTLRIPLQATNLGSSKSTVPTKLTFSALQELISLAQECEVLACPPGPKTSGEDCPQKPKPKSLPTSRPSTRK